MDEIFLSYRRDDAGFLAPAAADALTGRFGAGSVFLDVGSLRPGVPFPPEIHAAVRRCLVMVVFVGPRWLASRTPAGGRRIDDPADWVRQELDHALRTGIPLLPVLFDGASVPRSADLPADVRRLVDFGALRIDAHPLAAALTLIGDRVQQLAPRLPDATAGQAELARAGPRQDNRVDGGGDLFANQGDGGMTINVDRARRSRGRT